jgi:hypothetical protein
MVKHNFCASLVVFVVSLIQIRLALLIGNWGQHALIDEVEPTSDLRSSITLIDVPVRNITFHSLLCPAFSYRGIQTLTERLLE